MLTIFSSHRIVRIYPIFVIASLLLPNLIGNNFGVDLRALALIPSGGRATYRLNLIEWTLVFEMFFYVLLYAISIAGWARHIERIAIGWLIWTIAAAILGWAEPRMTMIVPFITAMPFQTTNAAFAAGMLIPALSKRGIFSPAMAPLAAGLLLLITTFGLVFDRLIASLAAVIFVGLVVQARKVHTGRSTVSLIATKFGDWSYALYLCHVPVIFWVLTTVELPPAQLWVLAVFGSLVVAMLFGILDIKIYKTLRRQLEQASDGKIKIWAAVYAIAYIVMASIFALKG